MTTSTQFVQKWVRYLNAIDREMSVIAAQKLGDSQDESVIPDLVKALHSRPDEVRTAAARALGSVGHRSAVPHLIKLLTDNNPLVASAAADSLGLIGDKTAVPALIEVMRHYRSDKNRHDMLHGFDRGLFTAALYALQKIDTPDARRAIALYNR